MLHKSEEVALEVFLDHLVIVPFAAVQKPKLKDLPVGGITLPSAPNIGPFMVPLKRATEQDQPPGAHNTL